MATKDELDGQIEGQMTIEDLFDVPERLFAVSRIFARARMEMNLAEQKTFVYALSQLNFTEAAKSLYVKLDKKTLAGILGINSDPDHLSVDLYDEIKQLPRHSYIELDARDKGMDFQSSGVVITSVARFKNVVRLGFNADYMGLFTGLSKDYLTMWSGDIFRMQSIRSIQFYEKLRQETDTRQKVNNIGLGIKALKEMFNIPKDGKGSYMRENGHFNRTGFEQYVIDPLCEDLAKCKMINLVLQLDGKYYEKVRRGSRVLGYRFYWTFTSHPGVATANETAEIQGRVDADPQVLKIAKDIVKGEKKLARKKRAANYDERTVDYDKLIADNRDLFMK